MKFLILLGFVVNCLVTLQTLISSTCIESRLCVDPLRIMVLVDGSGTVGNYNFEISKTALINLANNLNISETNTKMGIIQFSTKSDKIIDITGDLIKLRRAIRNMDYKGGWTNTKSAIYMAGNEQWNYDNTTNILLLMTDGLPQLSENKFHIERELERTVKSAEFFKEKYPYVDIITIAIGKPSIIRHNFFKKISDYPVFMINNYQGIVELFKNLSTDICTLLIKNRVKLY